MKLPASSAYFPYRPEALLRVSGDDAASFLQGQFTNDLAGLAPGKAAYGLWLDVKGRVQADSFVIGGPGAGEFWIASLFSPGALLKKRLEDFIIADDVTVEEPAAPWDGFALVGAEAGAWLAAEPRPGLVFPARRSAEPAWEWLVPPEQGRAARAQLAQAAELSAEEMERRRIAAGIPRIPGDLGPADLPNEGGLEGAAISYSKGCYLGQEVMARLKSRGRLRRRLARVAGRGAPPPLPAPLWRGAEKAGELRSAAPDASGGGYSGLALLAVGAVGAELAFSAGGTAALRPA